MAKQMKRKMKKITAFLLLTAMVFGSISLGETALADAAAQSSYKHSTMFKTTGTAQSNTVDGCYFAYEYGADGVYNPMAKVYYSWATAWGMSDSNSYPWVASWFVGASAGKDGVIRFHSARSGEVTVSGTSVHVSSGTQQLMIVQKRGTKYYPIYPTVGKYEWKDATTENFNISVTTTLKAEDEILFIARCSGQTIVIDPVVTFNGSTGTEVADSAFTAWGNAEPENGVTYSHSTLFAKSDKSIPRSFDIDGSYFQYMTGIDGEFSKLSEYSTTSWVGAGGVWTVGNDNYPWVAQWNIGIRDSVDGVISWHSAKEGSVVISSAEVINASVDRAELLIVQKRGNAYYPLYPTAGSFEWKTVTPDAFTLPEVTADVKAGDEILFIARADVSGIVRINPQIVFEEKEVESDEVFMEWPKSNALKTILCVGDSITAGAGSGANGCSYPKALQNILGSEYQVINLGLGGYSATRGAKNCYADTDLYEQGLAMDADMVLLMLGTKDCATRQWDDGTVTEEKYKESLLEMVKDYEAMPSKPEVVLMNIALISQGNQNDDYLPEHQRAILRAIDEVAHETGCRRIDIRSFSYKLVEEYTDNLHPNATAYAAMAEYIAGKITAPYYGDANADRKVNIKDIVREKKYLADTSVAMDVMAADMDQDGEIHTNDITGLRKYLVTGTNENESPEEWEKTFQSLEIKFAGKDDLSAYEDGTRQWQGCPSMEVAPEGRLWAMWFSGGENEPRFDNYLTAYSSGDGGDTWDQMFVIVPGSHVRALDGNLWVDPDGRLWCYWSQCYGYLGMDYGVFAMYTDDPDSASPTWSKPVRIANGIAINKPTILSDGTWMLPSTIWRWNTQYELEDEIGDNVYVSTDKGATWTLRGGVKDLGGARGSHSEHMVVELSDGTLRMNIRTRSGQYTSYSYDKGYTWTTAVDAGMTKTDSRTNLTKLASGNLLMVYNNPPANDATRSYMTAALSTDDGKTWPYKLLIDARLYVTYPDVTQDSEGNIYIIYDYDRAKAHTILMVKITEQDIINGGTLEGSRQILVNSNGKGIINIASHMFPRYGYQETSYMIGKNYFTYEYGRDGVYQLMKGYYTSSDIWAPAAFAWSQTEKTYPWIGDFFVGGSNDNDGVLNYHAGTSGEVKISNRGSKIYASAGIQKLMIVQKRDEGYYPIYPSAGSFSWKDVDKTGFVMPEITTTVEAGDEILFIARCDGQIVCIDPQIEYTGNAKTAISAEKFTAWGPEE